MDPNLTKDQILHPLIDAERRGVFNKPPESPYHWEMAQRDPDMPLEPLHTPFPDTPKKRPGERLPGGAGFKKLQQTCKALKINCVGMSVQEMRDAINKPPESPYHWEMAQRDPDMPLEPLHTPFPDTPKKRPGERLPGGAGFKKLQQTCKALKINCVGMSVQEMRDAINKVVNGESEDDSEVRPESGREGLEGQDPEVGKTLGPVVEKGSIRIEGED